MRILLAVTVLQAAALARQLKDVGHANLEKRYFPWESDENRKVVVEPRGHPRKPDTSVVTRPEENREPQEFSQRNHANIDSISRATYGLIDIFCVVYWGIIAILFITCFTCSSFHPDGDSFFFKTDSTIQIPLQQPETIELDPNMWSLCLASHCEQVTDWKGRHLRTYVAYSLTLLMSLLQLFTLYLIVFDINPQATPVTETPSSSWKKTGMTVNCMKFVMVFFLSLSVVAEASGACKNFITAIELPKHTSLGRMTTVLVPSLHYVVTLLTVLGGVCVVLSCQAVPSVLYNSLAILFVTQVDELFFNFLAQLFGLVVEWNLALKRSENERDTQAWLSRHQPMLRNFVVVFPMFYAFALYGRAVYTNVMPVFTTVGMQIVKNNADDLRHTFLARS